MFIFLYPPNSEIEWKYIAGGGKSINVSSVIDKAKAFFIIVDIGNNERLSIFIPKQLISDTEKYFMTGFFKDAGTTRGANVSVNKTKFNLNGAYSNGKSILENSGIAVYYR